MTDPILIREEELRQSIDTDMYWIEENFLANGDRPAIEALIRQRAEEFLAQSPAYDPRVNSQPADITKPLIYKTYMTVFPNVTHQRGTRHLFDDIHDALKPDIADMGLMLGQFYHGCTQEAIYDPTWKVVLSSDYPAFAIRYMVVHDHAFTGTPPARPALAYRKYFPQGAAAAHGAGNP